MVNIDDIAEAVLVALLRRYVRDFDWRACRLGSQVHTLAGYSLALSLSEGDDGWRPVTATN